MTTAADDAAVEDAFEAYLAGRPVPDDAADAFTGVAAFSEAVRATTTPGRPNAALAELLVTGLLTDQSSSSTRTARSAGSPPPRRSARVRIRRRTAMIFPVLLAKFLSAGAIAQAATGAGVAVVLVTGAGAVGVLPDPIQDTVATVVETVSPLELPDSGDTTADEPASPEDGTTDGEPTVEDPTVDDPAVDDPAVEEPAEDGAPADPAAFDAEAWALEGPQDGESFGSWVSLGAHNKALLGEDVRFGQIVSTWAHKKHLSDDELEAEGVDLEELTDVPAEPTATADTETEDADKATGKGNGNGNGSKTTGKGHGSKAGGNGSGKGDTGKGNGRD